MIIPQYRAQVDLLIGIIPYVAQEKCFALKGGTAINMFVWDMPRLSVDIDLAYLPFDDRQTALTAIAEALARIKDGIKRAFSGIQMETVRAGKDPEAKLLCNLKNAQVKIEVNTIMRGHIKPAETRQLSAAAQKEFGKFAAMQVISNAELFGGKICAALDRQHPRDLFDIHQLFQAGGITGDIKDGFIAALLSHNRPIHEMLKPNFQDQRQVFASQFQGMALKPFTYNDYENSRVRLVKEINALLTDNDRELLLGFKRGEPDWSLSKMARLQDLPAVKWKLQNVRKLAAQDKKKHVAMVNKLEEVFAL